MKRGKMRYRELLDPEVAEAREAGTDQRPGRETPKAQEPVTSRDQSVGSPRAGVRTKPFQLTVRVEPALYEQLATAIAEEAIRARMEGRKAPSMQSVMIEGAELWLSERGR